MIDFIDRDEQLKIEDPDWETFWDDYEQCWMMAEIVYQRCSECKGIGEAHSVHGAWVCEICDGKGHEITNIRWDDAISCEDFRSLMRQENWLRRRYGTPKPKSIVDYWLAS